MVERLGEWYPFSSELYCRKLTLYDHMFWNMRENSTVDNCILFSFATCVLVRAAPFGGSVAVIHHTALSLSDSDDDDCENDGGVKVHVYTSAGEFQASMLIPPNVGLPIDMEWTKEEVLVILTDKQVCIFFDTFQMGSFFLARDELVSPSRTIFLLDVTSKADSSLDVCTTVVVVSCMRSEGMVCIDSNGWLRGVTYEERCGPSVLNSFQLDQSFLPPTALDFIPGEWNDTGDAVFYLAAEQKQVKGSSVLCVFTISHFFGEKVRKYIPGKVLEIRLNHTGSQLALLTNRALLYILSSNLKSVEFSIRLAPRCREPKKMEWCGSSFVMLHFENATASRYYQSSGDIPMFSLLIPISLEASIKCERLDWEQEGSGQVVTVSEVDGVRVITEKACYFLEEVPKSLVSLCRFKPLSPSAQLVISFADEKNRLPTIRLLFSKWGGAAFAEVIDEVISAAEHEFSIERQGVLLAAASFANKVSRSYDSDSFVDVARRLRVLHAVRNFSGCCMPLSFCQYCALSGSWQLRSLVPFEAQVLIERLASRCCFQLAFDIVSALEMRPLRLLSQWSCHKVRDFSLDDNTVQTQIREVFHRYPHFSYLECSLAAFHAGRRALGVALLEEDSCTRSKVTALLLINQWELALRWADFSGDSDLIHLALIKAISSAEECTSSKLFGVLLNHPTALAWLLLGARVLPRWQVLIKEICAQGLDATVELFAAHDGILYAVGKQKHGKGKNMFLPLQEKGTLSNFGPETLPFLESMLCDVVSPSLDDALARLQDCQGLQPTASGELLSTTTRTTNYPLLFTPFCGKRVEHEVRWFSLHLELTQMQQQLATLHGDTRFIGCSVARTLYFCILLGDDVHAEELRLKYFVSEKKYTYTKLIAFCDAGKWDDAEKLGGCSSSKPSIGYLPFVELFVHHSQVEKAVFFISRLDNIDERIWWYMQVDRPQLAVNDAFCAGDASLIQQILKKTHDAVVLEYGAKCLQDLH